MVLVRSLPSLIWELTGLCVSNWNVFGDYFISQVLFGLDETSYLV